MQTRQTTKDRDTSIIIGRSNDDYPSVCLLMFRKHAGHPVDLILLIWFDFNPGMDK